MTILYIILGYILISYAANAAMIAHIYYQDKYLDSGDWIIFYTSPLSFPAIAFLIVKEWMQDTNE